jgi:tripartite-type tricarboxylate transporter receptor subunit TctC
MRETPALVALVLTGMTLGACQRAPSRDAWPTQPVRLIVPFGAGTGVDLAARVFAAKLAESWRHPVVVDNRPGPDGVVGTQAFVAAAAAKDVHTLLFAPTGMITFGPHLHENLPYDPNVDLVPVAAAGSVTLAIAVATTVEAASLADLAARVRQQPGAYLWATASPGGPELVLKSFIAVEKLQMKQVSYRETSLALQDIGAGRVQVVLGSLPTLAPLIQGGRVRLLAVTNRARSEIVPNVPTIGEAGYPALTLDGLWGLFGWKGIPDGLRRRLAADMTRAANDAELVKRLAAVGLSVHGGTPEEFSSTLEQQRQQAATLVRLSGTSHH